MARAEGDAAATTSAARGAAGARARRRRVRRPGRGRRDVQPLRGARLRGRRHRPHRRQQPARVHHRARARPLERLRHRRRQDGAGADLPRERRRPRGRGAGRCASRSSSARRSSKDVVVDLVCYRRYGHNEADEPAFTQPTMYELIDAHPSVRELYTQKLVQRGDLTARGRAGRSSRLPGPARPRVRGDPRRRAPAPTSRRRRPRVAPTTSAATTPPVDTAVAARRCSTGSSTGSPRWPDDFTVNPKLERSSCARRTMFDARRDRLGARRGARVRLARARGHAGAPRRPGHPPGHVQPAPRRARRPATPRREYVPARAPRRRPGAVHALRHRALRVRRARLRVRLLGRDPTRWCAGRRSSATSPTARRSSSTSSSSPPRQVGPAQQPRAAAPPRLRGPGARALERAHRALPHAVRRGQPAGRVPDDRGAVLPRAAAPGHRAPSAVPLVCFTPKRYLRMPQTRSPRRRRSPTARSELVLDDRAALDPTPVQRVHARAPGRSATSSWTSATSAARRSRSCASSSSTRGRRAELLALLDRYPDAEQVWWVQEEPANMGAWTFVHERLHRVLRDRGRAAARRPRRRARAPRAGAPRCTTASRSDLLAAAFAELPGQGSRP